ncbi:unnamed protein product [Owenia fusiformis]|uniref:Uncharacterized protein n=1 Tax=Owenia fusiformis TaxID=6347 RepID=A0A8J1UH89_OWEFU|nr:unnamed protein product [Owenia fusiformis]
MYKMARVLILLTVLLIFTMASSRQVLYKRMKNSKFLDPTGDSNGAYVRSLAHCNSQCSADSTCRGINYNHSINKCYLLNRTIISDFIPSMIETVTSWSHSYEEPLANEVAHDCTEWYTNGAIIDGTYLIHPAGSPYPFPVYCHNGSTIIQHRIDGILEFSRDWDDYKHGFGSLADEFWLGNDRIHYLSSSGQYEAHFEMKHPGGTWYSATYRSFSIADESDNYRLSLGDFDDGNAGDSLNLNPLFTPNGQEFTTLDADNENSPLKCTDGVNDKHGGWWYNNCSAILLNGEYSVDGKLHTSVNTVTGIMWNTVTFYNLYGNDYSSMMQTRIKLTRV